MRQVTNLSQKISKDSPISAKLKLHLTDSGRRECSAYTPVDQVDFWALRRVMRQICETTRKEYHEEIESEKMEKVECSISSSSSVASDEGSLDIVSFYDKLKPPIDYPATSEPDAISTSLRPYQKRALTWMIGREPIKPLAGKELFERYVSLDEAKPSEPVEFELPFDRLDAGGFVGFTVKAVPAGAYVNIIDRTRNESCKVIEKFDMIIAINGVSVSNLSNLGKTKKAFSKNTAQSVSSAIDSVFNRLPLGVVNIRFLRHPVTIEYLTKFVRPVDCEMWKKFLGGSRQKLGNRIKNLYIEGIKRTNPEDGELPTSIPISSMPADKLNPLWRKWHSGCRCDVGTVRQETNIYWNPFTGALASKPFMCASNSQSIGILADQMGLGKTVEVISLIAANQRSEAVMKYPITAASLEEFDITQLQTLKIPDLKNKLIPSRATLVVTPTSIINQWVGEIRKHAPNMTVVVYNGRTDPHTSLLEMAVVDVVLVTYATLAKEFHFSKVGTKWAFRHEKKYNIQLSALMRLHWWRVVLDEAQFVESTVTDCAKMASRLHAVNRWCVTGTPIGKNGLNDLYGLLLFLKHDVYSSRFLWRRGLQEPYYSSRTESRISNRINCAKGYDWKGVEPLLAALKPIFWRYSKQHVAEDLNLPPLTLNVVKMKLSPVEQEFYNKLLRELIDKVRSLITSNELSLGAINADVMHLRRALCHPQVVHSSRTNLGDGILSMEEIMVALVEESLDKLQMEQRSLCKHLNYVGVAKLLLYPKYSYEEAKALLVRSWQISQEVEVGRVRYQDEAAVVRAWKWIELQTVSALQTVCLRMDDKDEFKMYQLLEETEVHDYMLRDLVKKKKEVTKTLRWLGGLIKDTVSFWIDPRNAHGGVLHYLQDRRLHENYQGYEKVILWHNESNFEALHEYSNSIKRERVLVGKYYNFCAATRTYELNKGLILARRNASLVEIKRRFLAELLETTSLQPPVKSEKLIELIPTSTTSLPSNASLDTLLAKADDELKQEVTKYENQLPKGVERWTDTRIGIDDKTDSASENPKRVLPHPKHWSIDMFIVIYGDLFNVSTRKI